MSTTNEQQALDTKACCQHNQVLGSDASLLFFGLSLQPSKLRTHSVSTQMLNTNLEINYDSIKQSWCPPMVIPFFDSSPLPLIIGFSTGNSWIWFDLKGVLWSAYMVQVH